ncbi:hypothetical protein ACQEUU_22645 [Nonomuraea sp. CA-218870]|uniref:hypothetical protein n=1 Tax=Nonomuraea sp. CA-218870 TaxID=3239998 RepID=UPI003D8BB4EB
MRWDTCAEDIEELVRAVVPDTVDLRTSGSTGAAAVWRRTREQLWAEAGLLAGLLEAERPEAVLAFAPPRHVYGALATVLMPARMRVPVWYRPGAFGGLPDPAEARRWGVVAIPSVFPVLRSRMAWVRAAERVAVLHSTATLPSTAARFQAEAGPELVTLVEVFGSTESGGVASRRWAPDNPPWTLLDDVSFAHDDGAPHDGGADGEVPLAVRSGRLAARPGEPAPQVWRLDDYIEPLDERRFRFRGRRNRLLKVNGRRVNLDEVEERLRARLRCADLACLPVTDGVTGEHFEVLLVPGPGRSAAGIGLESAVAELDIRPRDVRVVERIERSETGKLRQIQQASSER